MNPHERLSKGDSISGSFEEALARLTGIDSAEGLMDMFVDSIPTVLGIVDSDHTVLGYNRPGHELFGLEPGAAAGTKCYRVFGLDEVCEDCVASRALETGRPACMEKFVPGTGLWLDVWAYPIRAQGTGEITGVIEHLQDITRSRTTDEELVSSESRHRHLLRTMQEGLVEQTGKVLSFVNDSFCRMIGYERSELIGSDIRMLFDDRNWKHFSAQQVIREQGRTDPYEIEMRRKDGSVLPVYVSPYAEIRDGTLVKSTGVITDISKLKQAEREKLNLTAQVQYAQKLESLGILAGGIAHDFNNLLMTILGNADLVLGELEHDSPETESIEEIVSAARHASDLARQMLAYAGRGRHSREPLNLNEVVTGMMSLMEVSLVSREAVELDLDPRLPAVVADQTQLRQIIMNLVTNASEAIRDCGSTVRVSTSSTRIEPGEAEGTLPKEYCPVGDFVCLEVSDDGCGIPPDIRDRLFDPFFTTKQAGRGLGLAVLLGIVSAHGGCVRVESEPGRGSRFSVLLPVDLETRPKFTPDYWEAAPKPEVCGAVLVIDDEVAIRDVSCRMIERLGIRAAPAEDLESARDHFRCSRDETALIIVDHSMPGLSGDQLMRALAEEAEGIPVVVSSGYSRDEVLPAYEGIDIRGFLQKPYGTRELARLLEDVLGT